MAPKNSKPENAGRRRFTRQLGWLSALVLIAPLFRRPSLRKVERITCAPLRKKTVKMLTRDGKLVEVDQSLLASNARKISNEELERWVVRK